MRTLVAVAGLVMLLGAPSWVGATPSTIVSIPSTDTCPRGTVHLDVDNLFTVGQGTGNTSTTLIGATYGVTDRVEVGLDYLTDVTNPVIGNVKLKACSDERFAVAVGAWMLGDEGTTGVNQVYVLASYAAKVGRFALGYAVGSRRTLGTDQDQVWASYDRALSDKWWVGADYISGDSFMGSLNVGAAYTIADNVSMILGYDFYNAPGAKDTVTAQLDVGF